MGVAVSSAGGECLLPPVPFDAVDISWPCAKGRGVGAAEDGGCVAEVVVGAGVEEEGIVGELGPVEAVGVVGEDTEGRVVIAGMAHYRELAVDGIEGVVWVVEAGEPWGEDVA